MKKIKITQIFDDAKDKNVAKTVLFYASNDETKTLYYEPTLENEVSKESLVDFFLKGLVIQAVTEGVPTGEYKMPTTLGEEKGGSGGSVEPVVLYIAQLTAYKQFLCTRPENELFGRNSEENIDYIVDQETIFDVLLKGNFKIYDRNGVLHTTIDYLCKSDTYEYYDFYITSSLCVRGKEMYIADINFNG
jgi:hypothetical protein